MPLLASSSAGAVAAVDEGVVAHQPLRRRCRGWRSRRGRARRSRSRSPPARLGAARCRRSGSGRRRASAPTRSRPAPLLGAGAVAIAGDSVAGRVKRTKRLLSMCSRSPGQGHSYSCGCSRGSRAGREIPSRRSARQTVACACPVSPAISLGPQPLRRRAAQIRSCSSPGKSRGDRCGRDERSSRHASDCAAQASPQTTAATTYTPSSARRHGVSPPADTNILPPHQRPAHDGQRVRAERYGEAPSGSSFDCEPWQTHSLEGGPDDLLSRPQPLEARPARRPARPGALPARSTLRNAPPSATAACRSPLPTAGAATPRRSRSACR